MRPTLKGLKKMDKKEENWFARNDIIDVIIVAVCVVLALISTNIIWNYNPNAAPGSHVGRAVAELSNND